MRISRRSDGSDGSDGTCGFLDFWSHTSPDGNAFRGKTPLHAAASNGQAAVVEKLLAAGAKVDATNSAGWCLRGWQWLWG